MAARHRWRWGARGSWDLFRAPRDRTRIADSPLIAPALTRRGDSSCLTNRSTVLEADDAHAAWAGARDGDEWRGPIELRSRAGDPVQRSRPLAARRSQQCITLRRRA